MDAGTFLGSFQILGPLGTGGMSEVYRGWDSKLHREVALKVIPQAVASDRSAISRLAREAVLLASLNHPHIATIHGIEEDGDTVFLVLELIAGRSLAARLREGPLTVREALDVGRQIADGLEATHAGGILHRDLKPSNVMLSPRGLVKLLDFGLAQGLATASPIEAGSDAVTESGDASRSDALAGTAPYMSPEQIRGEPLDQRSDVWAFGCVLYESLAARRAFAGPTAIETFAAILDREPDWTALPASTPVEVRSLIRRCLRKDRDHRLHHISDARIEIEEAIASMATAATAREEASIAVLPFLNIGSSPENEYFGEGLAEELIHGLGSLKGLRVASRNSSFQFKGKECDVRRLGEQLGVATVLDGSVRTAGDRVRVKVELVSVADGCQLWSQRFDGNMDDVFAIQDEIAGAIVERLRVQLAPSAGQSLVKRYTSNLEAYHLYMKGRYYWAKRHEVGLHQSLELFQRAIDVDPGHALAHSGVADVYWSLGVYHAVAPAEVYPLARAAALRALAIDDELAAAHVALGVISCFFDWDWPAAEREFRRAIDLDPTSALAHGYRGGLLTLVGRQREALDEARLTQQVDPLSATARGLAALILGLNGQFDEAASICRGGLEEDPDSFPDGWLLGWIDDRCGRHAEAARRLHEMCGHHGRRGMLLAMLARACAAAGDRSEAEAILAELEARATSSYVPAVHFAWIHDGLGHRELAESWMERAFAERTNPASLLMYGPSDIILQRVRRQASPAA